MGFFYILQWIYAYFFTLFDKAGVFGWALLGILSVTYIAFPVFMTWNYFLFLAGIFFGMIIIPMEAPKPEKKKPK